MWPRGERVITGRRTPPSLRRSMAFKRKRQLAPRQVVARPAAPRHQHAPWFCHRAAPSARERADTLQLNLVRAARSSDTSLVRRLLKGGQCDEVGGRVVLALACRLGHADVVRALLRAGVSPDAGTPLASTTSADCVQALLEAGAAPAPAALRAAVLDNNVALVRVFCQVDMCLDECIDAHNTALMLACERGFHDVAETLVDAGVDLALHDAAGNTALDLAAWEGHGTIVDMLVALGAPRGHAAAPTADLAAAAPRRTESLLASLFGDA